MPSVQLRDVCLDDQLVKEHERMLTGGFYAEVDLAYDAVIAQEKNGRPFAIDALRPVLAAIPDVERKRHAAIDDERPGRISRRRRERQRVRDALMDVDDVGPLVAHEPPQREHAADVDAHSEYHQHSRAGLRHWMGGAAPPRMA